MMLLAGTEAKGVAGRQEMARRIMGGWIIIYSNPNSYELLHLVVTVGRTYRLLSTEQVYHLNKTTLLVKKVCAPRWPYRYHCDHCDHRDEAIYNATIYM